MFAIVDVGGKQYRAEVGHDLVVDRLDVAEGETVELKPLLVSGGDGMLVTAGMEAQSVSAHVVEHMRGPRLVVFKFKPKRGFQRRNGFRSALTRLTVDKIV